MSSSPVVDAIPLTGADCMLRAFDREARRYHGASHASQLVLRLGAGLDRQRLRGLVEGLVADAPIVGASIRRPWLGLPVYDLREPSAPRLREHRVAPRRGMPGAFIEAMNETFDARRGELLRFDLVSYEDGSSDLALTWLHMLLDGSGSESFVKALADKANGARDRIGLAVGGEAETDLSFRDRGLRAREWQRFLGGFADHPTASPAGRLQRVPQRSRYRVLTLTRDETARATETAAAKAGFLTPVMFYMAVALRAHHALMAARGTVPPSYVVPLPVNIRPRGGEDAVFRTHVSMLWFQVRSDAVGDFDALLAELKRQRQEMIKRGLVDSGRCAIDFARYMPAFLFDRMVRSTLGGELCSFFFAFTGTFLDGVSEFCGAPIENGFHVPAVLPSPGSCVAMSVFAGRLNLTHVYQAGAVEESESEQLVESARRELLA